MNKTLLVIQQTHIGSLLSKKLDLALSAHGISFTEFVIMYNLDLAQNSSLSRISLAEKVALTASGVTRVLSPMEKNNLVTRKSNPRDARQSLVLLTDTGTEILSDATETVTQTTEVIFSLLNAKELSTLLMLLNKLKC